MKIVQLKAIRITGIITLIICMSLNTSYAQEDNVTKDTKLVESSYLELPQIQVIPIKDTQNNRQYELYVKLPEGYSENSDINYPVLYFTDAMWHIEILSGSTQFLIEDLILVGISWQKDLTGALEASGAHASRFRDYTVQPLRDKEKQAKYQIGQANNHLDFIRNDVINYVESNYQADSEKSAYFGYSAGGLFGAYILLTQPETFNSYILGSPALEGDIPFLSKLEVKAALKTKEYSTNVFISYGDLEHKSSPYIDEFINLLKQKNNKSLSLKHVIIEGNHETAFSMTAVRSMYWLADMLKQLK